MPLRALSLLRSGPVYRADRFAAGLRAAGFDLRQMLSDPKPDDVLLIWNRYSHYDSEAKRFEKAGARVIVAENSYLAGMIPGKWHAMALGHHNGAGEWPVGGPERWDALGVDLAPFRWDGKEPLILGQRSIGEPGIASPRGWEAEIQKKVGGRIRPHPGKEPPKIALADELKDASCVVTWASSAALIALMMGAPVWYGMERWIGAGAGVHVSKYNETPATRSDLYRLRMFQRLIWAQWRVEEIEDGSAFRHLLG